MIPRNGSLRLIRAGHFSVCNERELFTADADGFRLMQQVKVLRMRLLQN